MSLHSLGTTQKGCHAGHFTADASLMHLSQAQILR